jgi:nucleotide-binding universal stress UspA family protein
MKTILVPVDFSSTSLNAASYALQYAKQIGGKLILIHAYKQPLLYPLYQGVEVSPEGMHEIKKKELELLGSQLSELAPLIKVEHMMFDGDLVDVLSSLTDAMQVDFIVMGITGAGKLKETFIGSNTLAVAKNCNVPVLIVPENAVFTRITDIGLTTDFRDVINTIPDTIVSDLVKSTGARLHVLNVDFKNRQWTNDTPFQSGLVESMFQQYHPQYHFIDKQDMVEGLNEYANKFSIEILLVIPQKHNLIEKIFSGSHTKELIFHSDVPVMVMHE